ncbi:methyl-accepting chemotaxis protein [Candidatus Electronema sp. JM]|uniref:methyl-accepting chemotaxis protein n=1 Tax=Candidatus Electronema sp. JM TaxID=3401571 RepID=UPI003AA899BF
MANASKEKPAERILSRVKGLKAADLKGLFSGWRRSIRSKLLVWLLLISLVPLAVIALFSYRYSASALNNQSFETLEATLAFEHEALQEYFSSQEKTLINLTDTINLLQQESFVKLAAVRDLLKEEITKYLETRYNNVHAFGSNPEQVANFAVFAKGTAALDSDFAAYLKDWLKQRDFHSLTLLSPDGKVLFSTDEAVKPGMAVQEKSPEQEAFEKGKQETSFIDYGRSSFLTDKLVCYFSTPFKVGGQSAGVFLFQLDDNSLDWIMKQTPGLGESGESYLVGADGMFRSNSVYFEESTIANPAYIVDSESVLYALAGENGEEATINYRGDYVLSTYTLIEMYGVKWALMVETDQKETMAPKHLEQQTQVDHLKQLAEQNGFPDLYLLNPDGYIFYSAQERKDHFTNILNGPYSSSKFNDAVRGVLEKKALKVSDYGFYAPIDGKAAAFMAAPVLNKNGEVSLIVALQVPIEQINKLMSIRSQFEKKSQHQFASGILAADTYLVGPDKLLRSESVDAKKYGVDKVLLKAKADSKAVNEALAGHDGTDITVNSLGEKVLASWAPFKYNDLSWALVSEVSYDEVHKPVTNLLRVIGVTVLVAMALIVVVSLLVARGMTRQVGEIVKVMGKVEQGDYSDRVQITSHDELGRLAGDFNTMTGTIQNLIQTRQEEHDKLNSSIIRLLEEITVLADGDLTMRATVTDDVIGTLADSLNLMLENLGRAFRRIKDSALQVGSTAKVLSSSTGELADQNDSQAKMINQAVEKIASLTEEIRKAAEHAVQSAGSSKESSHVAEDGAAAVRETSHAMEAIRSNVQNTARAIKRLGESSQEISDFARTINEISDRTSILALNASIQAAAAGEEGRGFAVVAEEIQRLAERAAVSTRQIETLIRNILGEITEAGVSMDASIQEVVQGTKLSQNALAKLEEITSRSNEVAALIEGVANVSKEQAETTAQLAGKMKKIGEISVETAQETMGASISMQEMATMGDDMLQAVAAFKIDKKA